MGINVLNALAAANDVIIPIKADKNALDGMEELAEVIEEMKPYNPGLKLVKCLVTMFTKYFLKSCYLASFLVQHKINGRCVHIHVRWNNI